ncbi:hypothetical protein FOPG_19864 [Fusarium oxysporum f. sp. conglutinans race 2 54008]|uniref:Uncharacterized protein n=1 Tax=Fusarium oxysporum f. sp. conglutinans race 2 54008 TaxID=1089457 RepID=X0GVN5_FUSOX|nr:hypothetical protein FOPG_19864 [Fusarium oxysporum f. sp. conglutinans race 2 54008]
MRRILSRTILLMLFVGRFQSRKPTAAVPNRG